ncbi:NAD-dependent succinate-semialdehyde dehydrogenase [Sporichthya brevicatena]|uniref:NAD-dependent succinate-semialdehyde dehydrogenase n=1 Tax=Sporichthya brevicatena TaxID=171442 RepID=UPI0031E1D33E
MPTDLFIGGTWVESPDRVPVLDPATGAPIASVSLAGDADITLAVEAAADAAAPWAATPPRDRAELLRRAFELMTQRGRALAELITRENGKVLADAQAEVTYAAEFFRWFSEEATRIRGDYRLAPSGDKHIVVTHDPIGVSLLVTPWNFPAAMVTRKIAPALAAGCTVVLKPALETPLTALAIAAVLEEAGVPAGVVNVVLASPAGPPVRAMLRDARVRHLSFTGSTGVGSHLLREAASQVLRCSMELGGNAPFLVLEGADVRAAVDGALIAKLRNGGAACTAANRFYVHESLAAEFTANLSAAMAKLRCGPGLAGDSQLGALASPGERDKVAALVEQAIAEGARPRAGARTPEGPGAFYPATVLDEVPRDASILGVEIFGPVAPIVTVSDEDEAVALANGTEFGLAGYVYASDIGAGLRVAERLSSGMVAVNRGTLSDPAAPFGGVKQSGLGREGGLDGVHEFLETKYIAV